MKQTWTRSEDVRRYEESLAAYASARSNLFKTIELPASSREPLAEFCERLVAKLWGGVLAHNRNQAGWDVELPNEHRVQVKSLKNAVGASRQNYHKLELPRTDPKSGLSATDCAIVLLDDCSLVGSVKFPYENLGALGGVLRGKEKESAAFEAGWRFTRADWGRVLDKSRESKSKLDKLRVEVVTFPSA